MRRALLAVGSHPPGARQTLERKSQVARQGL